MVLPGTLPTEARAYPDPPPALERFRLRAGIGLGVVGVLVAVRLLSGLFGGSDSYAFMATQGGAPVTWDHCHAIRFQVNPKGAPEGYHDIVTQAVQDVEKASGFVFLDQGTTTKTGLIGQRYAGNDWEPVLIIWSDRYQNGTLDGDVAGLGGPGAVDVNGRQRYVVGRVSMDSTVTDPVTTTMVLEHELGHVLGLDHTDDPQQLMYPAYQGQHGLGSGDVAGLQALHHVPCG